MMEMNRFGILVIAASAALCFSCVRSEQSGINDANKRYFDAWMKINHPDAIRDGLGIYILDETTGKGVKAGNMQIDLTGFEKAMDDLLARGAEVLVLGCTELPVAFQEFGIDRPNIDPTHVLASAAVRFAGAPLKEEVRQMYCFE